MIFPPVAKIFELDIAKTISSNDRLYLIRSFSLNDISISSSGNPETETCEIPSIFLISFSMFLEIFFKDFKSISFPLTENIMVGCCSSILVTTTGSKSAGYDETLSTAFLTSNKIASISKSSSVSTIILPISSRDVDVTLTIPGIPFKLSSIL